MACPCLLLFICYFCIEPNVVHADLQHPMLPRITLNFYPSCLHLPRAGITGMSCHAQFLSLTPFVLFHSLRLCFKTARLASNSWSFPGLNLMRIGVTRLSWSALSLLCLRLCPRTSSGCASHQGDQGGGVMASDQGQWMEDGGDSLYPHVLGQSCPAGPEEFTLDITGIAVVHILS